MAESPSSALPGGIEWLPALGGAHLLRASLGRGDPPALILQTASGGELRVEPGPEARFSRSTDYLVPAGLHWSTAALMWPDGTRTVLPPPPGERAALISLPTRREPPAPPPVPDRAPASRTTTPASALRGTAPARPAAAPSRPVFGKPSALHPPGAAPTRSHALAPLHWTAPPAEGAPEPSRPVSDAAVAAETWRHKRTGLAHDLSQAAEAVLRVRDSERATGDAVLAVLAGAQADLQAVRAARAADAALLATLAGQLEAERIAHAATREVAAGADAAQTIREQLDRACHEAALARAEASALRAELQTERAGRALAEQALRKALSSTESTASLEEHAAQQARAAATATRRPPPDSGRLIAALDAAADSLRATTPTPAEDPPAPSETVSEPSAVAAATAGAAAKHAAPQLDASAALRALGYSAPAPRTKVTPSPWRLAAERVVAPRGEVGLAPRPGLLRALVALAREDSVAAGSLLAGLLPAQGAILNLDVSYDLTVRGLGTFAITVRDGVARVQRITRRRPRGNAAFHLEGDPLVLAELLAGEPRRIRRLGHRRRGLKVHGRRKRVRALSGLPTADLTLADAVRAGARLEPALVYRALPHAVAPEWTRGHVFTVAQEIVEFGPRAWYVTARDGVPLDVVEHVSGAAADATVTMTRATFDRLLRGEPAVEGELPVVRGNRAAVATLKRWTELAAGAD